MKIDFLHQDQDLAVIHKPPGWVVNDAETTSAPTIQSWWREQLVGQEWPADWAKQVPSDFEHEYGSPEEIFAQRQGIVHRLDKDTSGVLLLAKHPGSLVQLLAQFRNRQTEKEYLALVHGKLQVPAGLINAPLGRASRDRKVFDVRIDGRPAQTKYEVMQEFTQVDAEQVLAAHPEFAKGMTRTAFLKQFALYQGFSMVKCWPLTGRTHQIRVHLAHLQHPLVGDITYVGRKRKALDPLWCPRHFLHASQLTFTHPRTGQSLTVHAPLTEDLEQTLAILK